MFATKLIPSNSVYAPKDCSFGRVVNIQPQCPNRTNIWIVSAKPRLQAATISSEVKIISNKFIHFQLSNTWEFIALKPVTLKKKRSQITGS